jgi:molecular chaperone Hsp33
MLQSLGKSEITSILEERGNVEVHCDFCNRAYTFDAVDIAKLFASGTAGSSTRVH